MRSEERSAPSKLEDAEQSLLGPVKVTNEGTQPMSQRASSESFHDHA